MIDALIKKYEAEIAMAETTINIYLTNPVAIGEHPQHLQEIDKLLGQIEEAQGKMEILKTTFLRGKGQING